jgi:alpha-beta hydrolase superfamily lysophospholipase
MASSSPRSTNRETASWLRLPPFRYIAAIALLLAGAWLVLSFAAAWRLTRRALPPFEEPAPAVAWGRIEPLRLHTADGVEIGCWFVRGDATKPCAVLLHGNGDCRRSMLGPMEALVRAGFSAVAVSLRAHGDSAGDVNDFGFSARADVIAAVELAERELPGGRIVVLGQSLGAAAALFAAGELGARVNAYALESPYSSLEAAVENRTRVYLPPILDSIAYAGLVLAARAVLPTAVRIRPAMHVADIPLNVPVLFLAGVKDRHTKIEEIEAMASTIAAHATITRFENAAHSELFRSDPALYLRSVLECFGQAARSRQ